MSFTSKMDLHKKVERLSCAVFIVSNTIQNQEDLRQKIHSLVLELIHISSQIKDINTIAYYSVLSVISSFLLELASLIKLASVSGLISEMNSSILKIEFDDIYNRLEQGRHEYDEKTQLSQDYFRSTGNTLVDSLDPGVGLISIDSQKSKDAVVERSKNRGKEHREKAILDIIRARGSVNIKDISKSIKGCSEKTIQRKLISLVDGGILKKEGERRWSRYSLK